MPSMSSNEPLRRRLEEVVIAHDGCLSRAADALSLPRVFVWRFLRTGRAIPRNVQRLQQALDAAQSAQPSDGPAPAKRKTKHMNPVRFSRSDIAKTRHLLQYLIAALDAYEVGDMDPNGNPNRAASSY